MPDGGRCCLKMTDNCYGCVDAIQQVITNAVKKE